MYRAHKQYPTGSRNFRLAKNVLFKFSIADGNWKSPGFVECFDSGQDREMKFHVESAELLRE